jgi:hypothetical protein
MSDLALGKCHALLCVATPQPKSCGIGRIHHRWQRPDAPKTRLADERAVLGIEIKFRIRAI